MRTCESVLLIGFSLEIFSSVVVVGRHILQFRGNSGLKNRAKIWGKLAAAAAARNGGPSATRYSCAHCSHRQVEVHCFSLVLSAMRSLSILFGLLALAISSVYGTALTYRLGANEKACFFAAVERQNAKVAFYFAVCPASLHSSQLL